MQAAGQSRFIRIPLQNVFGISANRLDRALALQGLVQLYFMGQVLDVLLEMLWYVGIQALGSINQENASNTRRISPARQCDGQATTQVDSMPASRMTLSVYSSRQPIGSWRLMKLWFAPTLPLT